MKSIAIIGAGQMGLALANYLRSKYQVTLFSNKTAEQYRSGNILSSQGMFNNALSIERDWQLNFWDQSCPWNTSVTFNLGSIEKPEKAFSWMGFPAQPYQSVDQRLKFSAWLEYYIKNGGDLRIFNKDITVAELNDIASLYDLTIVTTGKGELAQLFKRDESRSTFNKPMRSLACMYVTGMTPVNKPGVRANIIPGIGEFFCMPGLSWPNTPCEMMLFEGIPGGPFDCWQQVTSPETQLTIGIDLLERYVPWEAERCKNVKLTDAKAILRGAYTPVVKEPVTQLPNGKWIIAGGDAVVLNDPIAGQGANNATKCAEVYAKAIIKNEDKPFNELWMRETFEDYWGNYAEPATLLSNMLLAPPPHVIDLMAIASINPSLANLLANAFDQPASLLPWIKDAEKTKQFISFA